MRENEGDRRWLRERKRWMEGRKERDKEKEGRKDKSNLEDEDKMCAINDYIITDWHR